MNIHNKRFFKLLLMGAIFMGWSAGAQAHHANITAEAACDTGSGFVIDYTATSWSTTVGNPQVDILFDGVVVDSGSFVAPDYAFSGSIPAPDYASGGDTVTVTALPVADWDNGYKVGSGQSRSLVVTLPDEICIQPASLGDRVWEDINSDGIQDCTDGGAGDPSFPADGVSGNEGDSGPECDTGIAGVTVNLYSKDVDSGQCDFLQATQPTDSNGFYLFEDLDPGQYCVEIIKPAGFECTLVNQGSDDSVDSDVDIIADGNSCISGDITLGSGETDLSRDAGLVSQVAALGDRVWQDLNGDGIQNCTDGGAGDSSFPADGVIGNEGDAGPECAAGVAGVIVSLLQNPDADASCSSGDETLTGSPVATDANGFYLFSDLEPADYCVEFALPAGYAFTSQDQGTDEVLDSDADPATGVTANVNLVADETDLTVDAGLILPASLGDFVWNDLDRDGIQGSEPGMEAIRVELSDCSGNSVNDIFGNPVLPVSTDINGAYGFNNLSPGGYKVKFTARSGFEFTTAGQGSEAVDSDAVTFSSDGTMGTTDCVILASGEHNPDVDAGLRSINESSLGDFVWNDTDADGIQYADELNNGIPGVNVALMLCDANDELTPEGATTITDANGLYFFQGLSAGRYAVQFDLNSAALTGFTTSSRFSGTDTTVDSDVDSTTGVSACVDLGVKDQNLTLDAGFFKPASLGDRVWLDTDSDGIQDSEEDNAGVASVEVELLDCSGSPVTDIQGNPVNPLFTDADGFYNFGNLLPGNYTVKFNAPTGLLFTQARAGTDDTVDSDAEVIDGDMGTTRCITLGSGESNPNVDAGLVQPPAECDLSVNASCAIIPQLPTSNFVCSDAKPLDTLSMIWTGQDGVSIEAHYGRVDHPLLTTVSNVNKDDVVTISGFAGAGNDVEWEIFDADGNSLGISGFHMSCSDPEMNGPEDCGSLEGNNKGNDSNRLNSWLLEGLAGQNGVALECNPTPPTPPVSADSCNYQSVAGPHCLGKVTSMGLRYLGGDCVISNDQEGKAVCQVSGSAGEPVRIKVSDGGAKVFLDTVEANVTVGDVVVATAAAAGENEFRADTVLEIFSSTGNLVQQVKMHTSCSKALNLGDQFGAVDVVSLDTTNGGSVSLATKVQFTYNVVNNSTERFVDEASDSFGVLANLDLAAQGGSVELTRTQIVMPDSNNVFNNRFEVNGNLSPSGLDCSAQDTVPVTREEIPTPQPDLTCSDIKPLTELSMVWNGADGTTITTVAGQVFMNLQNGSQITFLVDKDVYGNDFAVTLSGAVNGTSKFHLSCSDEDMNGSDDCGTAQGDNKGNDPTLVNDWLLDGMTGANGSFACNLPNTGVVDATAGGGNPVDNVRAELKELKGKEYKFNIYNDGAAPVTIQRITIDWPTAVNGDLKEIKKDGSKIYDTDISSSPATITSWIDKEDKRIIKAGDRNEYKFKFANNVDKNQMLYSVEIEFDNGTIVTLP